MSDKSLIIFQRGEDTVAALGEAFAGEDGMFDRYQIGGTYIRFLPGQHVPKSAYPKEGEAAPFVEQWVEDYGKKKE